MRRLLGVCIIALCRVGRWRHRPQDIGATHGSGVPSQGTTLESPGYVTQFRPSTCQFKASPNTGVPARCTPPRDGTAR